MKKILSAFLALILVVSTLTLVVGAQAVNEPTPEELEAIIKTVKPKLDVPEKCTEFTWRYDSKTAYMDARWCFEWETKSEAEEHERVLVYCDTYGNITFYQYSTSMNHYGQMPVYTIDELLPVAEAFIAKSVPAAASVMKLDDSQAYNLYNSHYDYSFTRYIDGYKFPDNNITVHVDAVTGVVDYMEVFFDYDNDLNIRRYDAIISEEEAAQILGTSQKMELRYMTRVDTDETTKEKTVKAFLVYVPVLAYIAVDAGTGEIYDTKSHWEVGVDSAAGSASNGIMMDSFETESAKRDDSYQLTDEELSGVNELAGLITKEEAIRAVTENPYLYVNPSLTAVDAGLNKNYSAEKTSTYRNDNGSYIWSLRFSNPVLNDKYYENAYAYATVNAESGQIISYRYNLNDYVYYMENKLEAPDVKYDEAAARVIGEEFLNSVVPEKFALTVPSSVSMNNILKFAYESDSEADVYGAYSFVYTRVNEGIKFNRNTINVGVDGVTGKIYNYNYNWWSNVEFESPKGAISPEEALAYLISYDGYGLIYEKNTAYIYTPVTESSKKDVCAAFIASLALTLDNGGNIDKVIDKYAKDIDRDKLVSLLENEKELLYFVSEYFGVSVDGVTESAEEYVDSSLFYTKEKEARLVYTAYALDSEYISPFSGAQLKYNGEEYKPEETAYSYDDLQGHWIEKEANILAAFGIGFEGGKFEPDRNISVKEFEKLSQGLGFYLSLSDNGKELDRISAIRSIMNYQGYEKIASLNGIYKTDFADNDTIKEADIGYTAIAFGLGIIKGDGQNANIYDKLTRAQAVSILINAMAVKQ